MLYHKGPACCLNTCPQPPPPQKNCCAAAGVTPSVHPVGHKVKEAPARSHWKHTETGCVAATGALLPVHTPQDSQHKPQPSAAATTPTTPCFATAHLHSGKLPWKKPLHTLEGPCPTHNFRTLLLQPSETFGTRRHLQHLRVWAPHERHTTNRPHTCSGDTPCVCGLAGNTCHAGMPHTQPGDGYAIRELQGGMARVTCTCSSGSTCRHKHAILYHRTGLPLPALWCSRTTCSSPHNTHKEHAHKPASVTGRVGACSDWPPRTPSHPPRLAHTHDMHETARVVVLCGVTGRPRKPQPQGRLHPTLHACKYTTPSHQMYCRQHLKRLLMQGAREAALRSRARSLLITQVYKQQGRTLPSLQHHKTNKAGHIRSRTSQPKPHRHTHTHRQCTHHTASVEATKLTAGNQQQ